MNTQTQKNQGKTEIELEYKIGALESAIEDLQHLDDVLWDLLDVPYARFAESALEWYENDDDIKDLLLEINEIANMIDEMPDEIREYLENIQDKIPRIIKKLKHRVHELEKQLGNEGGEP
jgi:Mg2+ and Co2+ transporter CorA